MNEYGLARKLLIAGLGLTLMLGSSTGVMAKDKGNGQGEDHGNGHGRAYAYVQGKQDRDEEKEQRESKEEQKESQEKQRESKEKQKESQEKQWKALEKQWKAQLKALKDQAKQEQKTAKAQAQAAKQADNRARQAAKHANDKAVKQAQSKAVAAEVQALASKLAKDRNEAKDWILRYMASLAAANIFQSYMNGAFDPAAIGQLQRFDTAAIRGTVQAVGDSSITLGKDGQSVKLAVHPRVFVYRDGARSDAAALKPGDQVLVRTVNESVIYIDVTVKASGTAAGTTGQASSSASSTQQQSDPAKIAFIAAGKFNNVTLNDQGGMSTISITQPSDGGTRLLIYNVSPQARIAGDASRLLSGQSVQLTGTGHVVEVITIL